MNKEIAPNRDSKLFTAQKKALNRTMQEEYNNTAPSKMTTSNRVRTTSDLKSSQYQSNQKTTTKVPAVRLDKVVRNYDSAALKAQTERSALNRSQQISKPTSANKRTLDFSYEVADNTNVSRDFADNSDDDYDLNPVRNRPDLQIENDEDEEHFEQMQLPHIDTPKVLPTKTTKKTFGASNPTGKQA